MSELVPDSIPEPPEAEARKFQRILIFVLGGLLLVRVGMWLAPDAPAPIPGDRGNSLPDSSYQEIRDNRTVRIKQSLETLGVLLALEAGVNGTRVFYTNVFASMENWEIQKRIKKIRPSAEEGNLTAQRELAEALLYSELSKENPDEADQWAQRAAAQLAGLRLLEKGRALSRQVCISCHQYPDPGIHTRADWLHNVFPWMEFMLGIRERVMKSPFGQVIEIETDHLPQQSPVTHAEWTAIQYFYISEAPARLPPLPRRDPISPTTSRFEVVVPQTPAQPSVCMVRIDPKNQCFYTSDDDTRKLYRVNAQGKVIDTLNIEDIATDMTPGSGGPLVTLVGEVYNSDAIKGSLVRLNQPELKGANATMMIPNLRRPVELAVADLNGDGRDDLVICEFGFFVGRVCWWEQREDGSYTPHELLKQPGGINVRIRDFNGDGRPDIVLIIAQAREGIHLFLNKGGGEFDQVDVRLRHPAWGYSHLEVVDFDRDGDLDLLVTNGDNGDLQPPPLRPYHGIRLLINDGKNKFEEKFFWPQNGAFGALPEDFDGDGDVDILAISYFPNYAKMEAESLVYLENQGGFKFKASTFPENITGRWLVMDKGDLDGDGDVDVVLGAFNEFPGQRPEKVRKAWKERGASLLILKNTTR